MTNTTNATKVDEREVYEWMKSVAANIPGAQPLALGGNLEIRVAGEDGEVLGLAFRPAGAYTDAWARVEVLPRLKANLWRLERGHLDSQPRATVRFGRKPESVARDLIRRVLTPGWTYQAEVAAEYDREEAAEARVAEVMDDLAAHVAGGWSLRQIDSQARRRGSRPGLLSHPEPCRWGRLDATTRFDEIEPTVTIELHGLTPEYARRVLAALDN